MYMYLADFAHTVNSTCFILRLKLYNVQTNKPVHSLLQLVHCPFTWHFFVFQRVKFCIASVNIFSPLQSIDPHPGYLQGAADSHSHSHMMSHPAAIHHFSAPQSRSNTGYNTPHGPVAQSGYNTPLGGMVYSHPSTGDYMVEYKGLCLSVLHTFNP